MGRAMERRELLAVRCLCVSVCRRRWLLPPEERQSGLVRALLDAWGLRGVRGDASFTPLKSLDESRSTTGFVWVLLSLFDILSWWNPRTLCMRAGSRLPSSSVSRKQRINGEPIGGSCAYGVLVNWETNE